MAAGAAAMWRPAPAVQLGFVLTPSASSPREQGRRWGRLSWSEVLGGRAGFRAPTNWWSRRAGAVRVVAGRKNMTERKLQQSKGRVAEPKKKLGAVGGAPVKARTTLPSADSSAADVRLGDGQAVGQVVTAQANFIRVIVQRVGGSASGGVPSPSGSDQKVGNGSDHKLGNGSDHKVGSGSDHKVGNGSDYKAGDGSEKEPKELLCVVRNVLKKMGRRVLVGDSVVVSRIDWVARSGMVEDVVGRTSEVLDPPVANVDHLLVVFSVEQPQIDEKVLSRFLVDAESTGIPFSLVLNKADLAGADAVARWRERLLDWGYDPVLCSARRRDGLAALAPLLTGRITVILGPSGVGKSSLINALRDRRGVTLWSGRGGGEDREAEEDPTANEEHPSEDGEHPSEDGEHPSADGEHPSADGEHPRADEKDPSGDEEAEEETFEELRVGEVSAGNGRGRHTTRHVSLLRLPGGGGGLLADTPGFTQPSLARVTAVSLAGLFPEVERRVGGSEAGRCAFPNCLHVGEPLCAVGADWDRYSHYAALLEEVRNREKVEKSVLGTKRESEVRYKVGTDGLKQAEPRLALKKHRRESRKHLNQSVEEIFRTEDQLQADIDDASDDFY